ncbi:hypothetical protein WR25_17023 isoform B [Diploscapter pachys]|uniref:HEAT repeat-containing protein 1 n=1 Tax=Diploscapter pachys TaxID=2018661 RepID=A0A2A2KEG3_9BILA|nr:hypothetical protein WR25_17023 isoform B [Diploscapter pachys]
MTSLEKQLESLRTATARQLTVERKHVSILFDQREAASHDRETIYKIGCTGLEHLRKIDSAVFDGPNRLFDESALNLNRSMLTKEENEQLDGEICRFLFLVAPYLQHFACQQTLEWLIYRFQIHAYNAESLMLSLLPFHETNVFGRILSVLDFQFDSSKEWSFLKPYARKRSPVPFNALIKSNPAAVKSLINKFFDHIQFGIETTDQSFMEVKASILFTFYAKLVCGLLDSKKLDDALLSRIVPLIANGIKSSVRSLRLASFMIVCQLVCNATLAQPVISSILKILIMKTKLETIPETVSMMAIVCQRQKVPEISRKAILKLLRREELDQIWERIRDHNAKTELSKLLDPLWETLFRIAAENGDDSVKAINAICVTADASAISSKSASAFFKRLFEFSEQGQFCEEENFKSTTYSLAVRFSDEYMSVVSECRKSNPSLVASVIEKYGLTQLTVTNSDSWLKKKRKRTRSSQSETSVTNVEVAQVDKSATEKAQEMAESSEFAKRKSFSGDPMKKCVEWMKKADWENVEWALTEMGSRRDYFQKKPDDDVEDFVKMLVQLVVENPSDISRSQAAGAIARPEAEKEPESESFKSKRMEFALDWLLLRDELPASRRIFNQLFEIMNRISESAQVNTHLQQSIVQVLIKMIRNSGSYKVTEGDLQLDGIVEAMRSTHNHLLLRNCLQLLTAAVKVAPASVTSHVMSVFTFMGSGLLKRDNELTLSIIEQTVSALFEALQAGPKDSLRTRLISVCRIFAKSAFDIPPHRRPRIGASIAQTVPLEHIPTLIEVFLECFCAQWQKTCSASELGGRRTGPIALDNVQDAYEDICMAMTAPFPATTQLATCLELIQFAVQLGTDSNDAKRVPQNVTDIFDKSKYSLPKLRHFRFVLIGIATKTLQSKQLYDKLSSVDDDELLAEIEPIGLNLVRACVDLDEMIERGNVAVSQEDAATKRYWVAMSVKAETLAERALQLANVKLMQDGYLYKNSSVNEKELIELATVLNQWIKPSRGDKDKIILCQSAAFSLKLIAKRLPAQGESTVLSEAVQKCFDTVSEYKTLDNYLVANMLLLAGELIRSHNMKSTMMLTLPLIDICLAIIAECITLQKEAMREELKTGKRERIRQQSLVGRKLSADNLLFCALTCVQRILDRYGAFVIDKYAAIIVAYCRAAAKLNDHLRGDQSVYSSGYSLADSQSSGGLNKPNAIMRLNLIRKSLLTVEFRVIFPHFIQAVGQLKDEEKPFCCLFNLLGSYFTPINKNYAMQLKDKLANDVFLPAMAYYRVKERNPGNLECIAHVETSIFAAFNSLAEILTEQQIRPLVQNIIRWAESELDLNVTPRTKIATLFHFANR